MRGVGGVECTGTVHLVWGSFQVRSRYCVIPSALYCTVRFCMCPTGEPHIKKRTLMDSCAIVDLVFTRYVLGSGARTWLFLQMRSHPLVKTHIRIKRQCAYPSPAHGFYSAEGHLAIASKSQTTIHKGAQARACLRLGEGTAGGT